MLIHSETFNSSTLPTGWNDPGSAYSEVGTTDGISPPTGGSFMLDGSCPATDIIFLTWATQDGNSGNVVVQCDLNDYVTPPAHPGKSGVFARGSSASMGSGDSCYIGWVNWQTGAVGISLRSGTESLLVSTSPTGGVSAWATILFTLSGSSLSVAIQNSSGQWWDGSSWGSTQATAASTTDSTLTGQGYSGVFAETPAAAPFEAFHGNWSISTAASPSSSTGSIAATEGHDSGSLAGTFKSSGSLSKTEGHDTASITASVSKATLSKQEGHDAPSVTGVFTTPGALSRTERRDTASAAAYACNVTLAATERHDVAEIIGGVPDATLDQLDGRDVPSFSGEYIAAGVLSIPDGPDLAIITASQKAASAAVHERHDTGSIAGVFSAVASPAISERHDTATLVGFAHNGNTLDGLEHRDTATISGSGKATASLTARESRDRGVLVAGTLVRFSGSAVESRDRASILSIAQGVPPSFRVQERGDFGSLIAGNPFLRYNIYMSPVAGAPINYATPVGTTQATHWSTGTVLQEGSNDGPFPGCAFPGSAFTPVAFPGNPKAILYTAPGAIVLSCPGVWSFGVRAENENGIEQNLDCRVTITLDADGNDISNLPSPPTGLMAIAMSAASIRVVWTYGPPAGARTPTGFHLYAGIGSPDYGSPAATVPYSLGLLGTFSATLSGLLHGQTYAIAVRAFNAVAEEQNQTVVTCTADGMAPTAVLGLTAVAVA